MSILLSGLALWGPSAAHAEAEARIGDGDAMQVLRLSDRGIATLAPAHGSVVTPMPAQRVRTVRQSNDFFFVGRRSFFSEGKRYVLLVTQAPSTNARGKGFCGAGTEDVLHLLEVVPEKARWRLRERDSLLLQSCLRSMELIADDGAALRARLELGAQPDALRIQRLTPDTRDAAPQRLVVRSGKLRLEPN